MVSRTFYNNKSKNLWLSKYFQGLFLQGKFDPSYIHPHTPYSYQDSIIISALLSLTLKVHKDKLVPLGHKSITGSLKCQTLLDQSNLGQDKYNLIWLLFSDQNPQILNVQPWIHTCAIFKSEVFLVFLTVCIERDPGILQVFRGYGEIQSSECE